MSENEFGCPFQRFKQRGVTTQIIFRITRRSCHPPGRYVDCPLRKKQRILEVGENEKKLWEKD